MAYIHEYGKNKAEDVLIPSGYNSRRSVRIFRQSVHAWMGMKNQSKLGQRAVAHLTWKGEKEDYNYIHFGLFHILI